MQRTSDATIVGGGGVGLMTALAMREFNPELDVRVIDDFSQPLDSVGKSTFFKIRKLLFDDLGFDQEEFLHTVEPVWKYGIQFDTWFRNDEFLAPFDATSLPLSDDLITENSEFLYRYETENFEMLADALLDQGRTPVSATNGNVDYQSVAYHLPLSRFISYVRDKCEAEGVSLVDDRITDVDTEGNQITAIQGESDVYSADLYVDSTGFRRELFSSLDTSYRSFDIPLDSAVKSSVNIDMEDIHPATIVDSAPAGWTWQVDTVEGRDMGYVFSSLHETEAAARELLCDRFQNIDTEENPIKSYEFDSGMHQSAWVGNCVSVGNAFGFIEPLQATGFTTAIDTAVQFSRLLSANAQYQTEATKQTFNDYVSNVWESTHQFIKLHYGNIEPQTQFESDLVEATGDYQMDEVTMYDDHGFTLNSWLDQRAENPDGFQNRFTHHMLYHLGVESDYYEQRSEVDHEIPDRVKTIVDRHTRELPEQAREYATYTQLYGG